MELGLADKTAVVTGGSEGIGRAIATELSKQGCNVAIGARRGDVLEQAAQEIASSTKGHVAAVVTDVAKTGSPEALVEAAVERFGRLDILVNNAGRSAAYRFEDATEDIWHEDLQLKLFGAIRTMRAAIPHMRAAGGGSIVNITTVGGKQPGAESVPTSTSRAAGIALTKAASKDYAADNIRVNTVMVGSIRSMQSVRVWEQQASGMTLEEFYTRSGQGIPLGRIGYAEEVADLVAFMVSERAVYITGTSIAIDGGASSVI